MTDNEPKYVGEAIQKIRIRRGCSQQQVADVLLCSRDTVSKMERGERPLRSGDIEKLKKFFYQDAEEIDSLYKTQYLRKPHKKSLVPAEQRCPHQEGEAFLFGIQCEPVERRCERCGWNPEVDKERRARLFA